MPPSSLSATPLPKEITPKLEKLFGGWKSGDVPVKNIGQVEHANKSKVYLLDRPGSLQSVIFAGNVAPPKSDPAEIAIESMNTILGGAFSSRLNLNLREDKHWCYGAGSFLPAARGQRPFVAYAPVQTDKTKESMVEIDKELRGILGNTTHHGGRAKKAQENQTLELPGRWETDGSRRPGPSARSCALVCRTTISRPSRTRSALLPSRIWLKPPNKWFTPTSWSGSWSAIVPRLNLASVNWAGAKSSSWMPMASP